MSHDCPCTDWLAPLARQHAPRLAAIARSEGLNATDALDAVQDGLGVLLRRADTREVDALPLVTDTPEPAHHLERAEMAAQLDGCMAELGDVHRRVVTLRLLDELSGPEVAEALGLTPGNVAVLLHRAKKQLERCLKT